MLRLTSGSPGLDGQPISNLLKGFGPFLSPGPVWGNGQRETFPAQFAAFSVVLVVFSLFCGIQTIAGGSTRSVDVERVERVCYSDVYCPCPADGPYRYEDISWTGQRACVVQIRTLFEYRAHHGYPRAVENGVPVSIMARYYIRSSLTGQGMVSSRVQ